MTQVDGSVAVIVLTGMSDAELAVRALQTGAQDYLIKGDFSADLLHRSIRYALERTRIQAAERQLLEQTLHGSIAALTAVLALANPTAFGRAARLKMYVTELADRLGIQERWHIEVAAMVSQIGCISLPQEVCERLYNGSRLTDEQQQLVDRLPDMAHGLLSNIPRLEPVLEVLASQTAAHCDRQAAPASPQLGLSRDAQMLRIAMEFDHLDTACGSAARALSRLAERREAYAPEVFNAFVEARLAHQRGTGERTVGVQDLCSGMVLSRDVMTCDGRLLMARGFEITEQVRDRLRNYHARGGVQEPLHVLEG
jgi:hypothetical protein